MLVDEGPELREGRAHFDLVQVEFGDVSVGPVPGNFAIIMRVTLRRGHDGLSLELVSRDGSRDNAVIDVSAVPNLASLT